MSAENASLVLAEEDFTEVVEVSETPAPVSVLSSIPTEVLASQNSLGNGIRWTPVSFIQSCTFDISIFGKGVI